jgi:signal transduction histidine kinase
MLEGDGAMSRLPRLGQVLKAIEDSNGVIGAGAKRVDEIVRRLRKFTRLDEAGLKKADLREGIEDAVALLREEWSDRITVHLELANMRPIACHPAALNQLFLNLLRNAIAAIDGSGNVWIRLWEEGESVLVSIRDDGRGIPQERLASLFETRFTTKRARVGASMGLSISDRIVREHQGEIRVTSVPGEGTTFTVQLPNDLERRLTTA